MQYNILKSLNYEITDDLEFLKTLFPIPYDVEVQLKNLYKLAQKGKKAGIKRLTSVIEQYPEVPILKNYLSLLYANMGNPSKSYEINHLTVEKHPNYTMGILSLAEEYFESNQLNKIPQVLGETLDWKAIFPLRDKFHVFEVSGLQKIAVRYFCKTGNFKDAQNRLYLLEALDNQDDWIEAQEYYDISKREYDDMREDNNIEVNVPLTILTDITDAPDFNFNLINLLYIDKFETDNDAITDILKYSRTEIITDLEKVLADSINRYQHFQDDIDIYDNEETISFIGHAVLLLGELESTESLENIFHILSQEEEFLDFYINDFIGENLWIALYKIGQNQLDACKSFMMRPGIYANNKALVAEAVSQIAHHQPKRRAEVLEWYNDIFTFFLNSKINDNVLDSRLNAMLIYEVIEFNGKELIPIIEELYKYDVVDFNAFGDFNEVESIIKNSDSPKKEILSITKIYDEYKSWNDDDFDEYDEYDEYDDELSEDFVDKLYEQVLNIETNHKNDNNNNNNIPKRHIANYNDGEPIVNETPKIGRNEPCPCGSGKKYKKCCINK